MRKLDKKIIIKEVELEGMLLVLCPWCKGRVQEGDETFDSTIDYPFCNRCGRVDRNTEDWTTLDVVVQLISFEECDCGDHIRHNNGGNYHSSKYKVIKIN